MPSFRLDLTEKRRILLEAVDQVPGLGSNRSERLEKVLEVFLSEHKRKVSQSQLDAFGAVDNAPKITDKLDAADFEKYTPEDCLRYADAADKLADQCRYFARKKSGTLRTVKIR